MLTWKPSPRGEARGHAARGLGEILLLWKPSHGVRILSRVVVERKRNGRSTFVARICSFWRSFRLTPAGGSSRARDPRARRNTVVMDTFPRGGKVSTAKPLTNEGLGDFFVLDKTKVNKIYNFLFEAKLKSESLANPSSVSSSLADSFPPQGKFKDTRPEGSAKDCCLGNLPPRLAYSRELYRRPFLLTPIRGKVAARSADG